MTYEEVLKFLYDQLPMFHRIGPAAYKPGLDNTIALMEQTGNPERGLKCVHVAGTNGKGSTSHLIASVLQEAGYKTGLYTSPHLKDFRERIRVNGEMIDKEHVVEFVHKNREKWNAITPSFFEITVALAFSYFKDEKTDINVIEVGLGGRLDSTNVIVPEVSVITNIGYDHMNLLGETIEKIASEKAGIIKSGIPVVAGKMRSEAYAIIKSRADELQSVFHNSEFYRDEIIPASDLIGPYQIENRKTAYMAISVLKKKGWEISGESIQRGFANVSKNTGLAGRWQVLNDKPLVIADVAHNEDGLTSVMKKIRTIPHKKLRIILGMVEDKDISKALLLMPKDAVYYFTNASIPRALPSVKLKEIARDFDLNGNAFTTVGEAFESAQKDADNEDIVLVTGSVFVVAEI
jgi:dihydrofolate synthase/folylpolyglutamate synthase